MQVTSNMSDVPPATFSRLLSLPTELLAHIVALVHLQDLAYRARLKVPEDAEDEGDTVWTRSWGGKTLGVVALLCKRLRQLAVPHQFQVSPDGTSRLGGVRFALWGNGS